ncbi:hypothetical protein K151_3201 [Proteus hauseri ZMd44]|nr:hypothetical protein K151_3201 [Proteus hauseri ZMd44]
MYNEKSLQDKQLIRSISDLIIQNPSRARELFGDFNKIKTLYPELSEVCDLVLNLSLSDSDIYINNLHVEINKIPDKTTKNIFKSALDFYLNNKIKNSPSLL